MDIQELLVRVFGDPMSASAVWVMVVLSIGQVLAGVGRAIANQTFELSALAAWVRADVAGKVLPIIGVFLIGVAIGDSIVVLNLPADQGIKFWGMGQAVTYSLAALASIKNNVAPPNPQILMAKERRAESLGDPIPTE